MYQLIYHELIETDLKRFSKPDRQKIRQAIYKKLKTRPDFFGKPLWKELKGYYRLRVEDYRIVYQIQAEKITVFVIHIGFRRDDEVYKEALRRLSRF